VKAIILDWAGTAVDYGSMAPTAVFIELFERRGVRITPEDARSGMGLMKKDHLKTILARPQVAEAWRTVHGSHPSNQDVDDLFSSFVPLQLKVLKKFAQPIPGLLEVVKDLLERDIKVGSTTGYIRTMMDVLAPESKEHGYSPDCIVCPDEVPAGRPYPWMCYQNAMELGIFPMQAMIKVGDTLADIEEGLNAGMWTVGVALTGNLLGLEEAKVNDLSAEEKDIARRRAASQLLQGGAHYVIDGIWALHEPLNEIQERLRCGEHP
jgi:phosphonoacetaldehyde hydrolase